MTIASTSSPTAPPRPPRPTAAGPDLARLGRYFAVHVPHCRGPLHAEPLPHGRAHPTYAVTDGHHHWVVRRAMRQGPVPTAHDVGRAFRVMRALRGHGVALPEPVAHCAEPEVLGAPFVVTSRVTGRVLRSAADVRELTPQQLRRCSDGLLGQLATLHAVRPEDAGLASLALPGSSLRRQVEDWRTQWEHVATRALPSLPRLYKALCQRMPAESATTLVHGGYRLDRAILDPDDLGRVRALTGWELATVGDPLVDLGLLLAHRDPAVNALLGQPASTDRKFPGPRELAEQYALLSGRDVEQLPFYVALAFFRTAVIAESAEARWLADPAAAVPGPVGTPASVPALVRAGLAALGLGRGAW